MLWKSKTNKLVCLSSDFTCRHFVFFHKQSQQAFSNHYLHCSSFPLGETEGSGRRCREEQVGSKTEKQESEEEKKRGRGNKFKQGSKSGRQRGKVI